MSNESASVSEINPETPEDFTALVVAETASVQREAQIPWNEGVEDACQVLCEAAELRAAGRKRTRTAIFKALASGDSEALRGYARNLARARVKGQRRSR